MPNEPMPEDPMQSERLSDDTVALRNRIRKVLLECPFAVLTTVGDGPAPFARWMTPVFAAGSLKEFHALACPRSRKLDQIRANPSVAWVFASPQFEDVVTIHGAAEVDDDPLVRAEIWESLPDKRRAFILASDENLEFLIIRTVVERIEYLRPRSGETTPRTLEP